MQRKTAVATLAVGNAAHGECFIEAAALASNHDAGENLNSFLVSFHHTGVDADAVTDFETVRFGLVLFFFDRVDDAVHKLLPGEAGVHFAPSQAKSKFLRVC